MGRSSVEQLFSKSVSISADHSWTRAAVQLQSDSQFRIQFVATAGLSRQGMVAVDDVSFSNDCFGDSVVSSLR